MIKNYIIPKESNVVISIPSNYIGKPLEILVYTLDELIEENKRSAKTMGATSGVLTDDEAMDLQQQIKQNREEWDAF